MTTSIITSDAQALSVAEEIAQKLRQDSPLRDRERRLPHAELDLFSRSGLWAISVPKAFGGAGVSNVTLAKVIARIAQADASLGQIPQNHFYALEVLRVNGSTEQQRRLYGEVLKGQRFGNALAELGTKTAHDRTTRLTRDGEGFRIDGRKFYATGALYAQRIPTSVVDEHGTQHLAFVPANSRGLQVIDDWSGFGQRTTGSGSVVFDNVFVRADDVVPFDSAFERPTPVGPLAQILHAAIDTGIARAAYEDALHFVRTRSRPWVDSGLDKATDDPLTLKSFGHLAIRLHATEALLERAGEYLDRARDDSNADTVAAASIAVAEARAISTEISLAAGTTLFELAGSQATLAEHNLDRHWRNARVHTLHDPVRWKYHAIGNYYLNDTNPPRRGTI
ncbi:MULTISPECIES: SfnB family sulfur acquisition oxidoreductase [Pseudomonas]|uniref:SfnB family sulfur acquisition oxidoreductase n=1 Tax=Pseudomonas taiwanensis TaxID=470150 RepID=A0ABR6VF09_9PSED|nr:MULTISPECIES: SfnB family sulfur acquisition oxidoreductase [Pseudomonas]AGZ33070.1 type 2 acyl-CoA dehydrogenase [Pseudomonas sp. VLB120]MBC3478711.1 SfnB family sulfur acquisition oxidoreductase [Pseudomonas taiwanensis]MBC3492077.1 SfnB family sulfur acquisition oxidoreductase [Pseudomonas taiwanensis]MPS97164.1 SfnB family sulfur acquisition oxidoreductase [Pseudomonas sp.]QQZ36565.1 SfnB family sulfur acquisition oxidoreductase [Pseudomonas sp. SK2]